MHSRLDKLKNKVVGRRLLESLLLEVAADHHNSHSNPMIVISEASKSAKPRTSSTGSYGAASTGTTSRLRALSLVLIGGSRSPVGRSHSTPKKLTKELIKHETAQVILKKLLHVLLDLGLQHPIPLRTASGNTSGPVSKTAKVYVANTNDCIYLAPASSASFTYEDVENGGIPQDHPEESEDDSDSENSDDEVILSDDDETTPTEDRRPLVAPTQLPPRRLRHKMRNFSSPNYLCTKIDADSPIPHTFAVVIELSKETTVKDVRFEFQSVSNVLWPTGDPYNKTFVREKFKVGLMEWSTTLADADFFINTANSNDVRAKKISPAELARRTRHYKLVRIKESVDGVELGSKSLVSLDRETHLENTILGSQPATETYKAGIYVFLLPVLLPEHIPPTVVSINGSLTHSLNVSFNKVSDKLSRKTKTVASYSLPMVRTPPSFANSIADKPIYVNRVWNDALHYIITFPKKYVALGSEHVINVKLVPMVKDVIIKRIKFNVLERITYVSKNLQKEYDYDGDDPFFLKGMESDKSRERVVSVCELKTKHKTASSQPEPYKEEVIKCPDNNLLFSCYVPEDADGAFDDPLARPLAQRDTKMIATPLDINIALPFLTTRFDKLTQTASGGPGLLALSNPASRRASISLQDGQAFNPLLPVIGSLETNLKHGDSLTEADLRPETSALMPEDTQNQHQENVTLGYTSVSKALSPDSNYRHIQIHHRLQVCFRISKPDPLDNYKMHHYEVVVDTPLILLSAKCSDESVQLPRYDELGLPGFKETDHDQQVSFRIPNFDNNGVSIRPLQDTSDEQLPSFEEATSPTSSPVTRCVSLGDDLISRIPSITPSDPAPAYEVSASQNNHDIVKPLNIDALVNYDEKDAATSNRRQSRLRSSLVNSFAPTTSSSMINTDTSSSTISRASNNSTGVSNEAMGQSNKGLPDTRELIDPSFPIPGGLLDPDLPILELESSVLPALGLDSSVPDQDLLDNLYSVPSAPSLPSVPSASSTGVLALEMDKLSVQRPSSEESLFLQSEAGRNDECGLEAATASSTENATEGDSQTVRSIGVGGASLDAHDVIGAMNGSSFNEPAFGITAPREPAVATNSKHSDAIKLAKTASGPQAQNGLFSPVNQPQQAGSGAPVQLAEDFEDEEADEVASLFTQETSAFEQRLPLLANVSIDNLSRSTTNMSGRPANTNKILTDSLSIFTEANPPPQDIYHSY